MPLTHYERLEERIDWKFIVEAQHFWARYGMLGNDYWKQHLPGGATITSIHPPRKISKHMYDMAKRHADEK